MALPDLLEDLPNDAWNAAIAAIQNFSDCSDLSAQSLLVDISNAIELALADPDPTPYCTWCNAMDVAQCGCGPRAENN
jgi:hypothetical protein